MSIAEAIGKWKGKTFGDVLRYELGMNATEVKRHCERAQVGAGWLACQAECLFYLLRLIEERRKP